MNKTVKKILIIILITALVFGGGFGGILAVKNVRKGTVKVFSAADFSMTDYWEDSSSSYGMVTTDNLQNVYLSETQQVTEILVSEGQKVQAGEPLLRYDTTLSDIALERAKTDLEKQKLNLENAKKELDTISHMTPHYMVLITPETIPSTTVPLSTPYFLDGKGSLEEPVAFLWGAEDLLDTEFLNGIYQQFKPKEETIPEESDPTEPTTEPGSTVEEPETSHPAEEKKETGVYLVFLVREENKTDGIIQNFFGIYLNEKDGKLQFRPYNATIPAQHQYENIPQEPYYEEYGSPYTAAEIAQMRSEKEHEVSDLEISVKTAEVTLKQMEDEVNNGLVLSTVDGYVQNLISQEEALMTGQPLMCVTDGGGYYITVSLSELDMATVQLGQSVTVNSWENGTFCDGSIVEISQYPSSDDNFYYGNGNSNVTYYPFKVYVDGSVSLREYSYVNVSYQPVETASKGFYLEKMFVRTENGKSFVYVQGADGKLEQRFIRVGRTLWDSYYQILSGITTDDYLAFPYGRDVESGAKTEVGTISDFYNMG